MELDQLRGDFMVYVVDDEDSIRDIVQEALEGAGYSVQSFPSAETALEKIQAEPPHVVLSDIRMPGMNGIQLLERVRKLSEDIQFIIMTSHASLDTAVNAMRLGAYDYLNKPFEELEDVIKTVDRTIEKLFLKFQNEQLLEELESKNDKLLGLNKRIAQEKEEVVAINNLMAKMAAAKGLNEVVDCFLSQVSELTKKPVIFMKHLASYSSLIVSNSSVLDIEKLKKVGVSFKDDDPKIYRESLKTPGSVEKINMLMKQVFKLDSYLALPVDTDGDLNGIVISFDPLEDAHNRRLFDSFFHIFKVFLGNATLQQKIHNMAIKDPLTGLYNRRFFNERLEGEISRSRRTKHPVSLIYMDIDHFKTYNDKNGHPMGDVLLKMVATLLMKTSRSNDIVARVGGEEFVIILPHTHLEGAAIKAEKLRRTIWNTDFPHGEKQPMGRISMSMGVSEYPTTSSDPETIVQAADNALYQIKETTRNRVCVATVAEGFVPDFEPIPVEGTKGRD
jgi:diguanylate cyclase (GGDEF)-like protein